MNAKTLTQWPDLPCNTKYVINSIQCNLFEIQDRTTKQIVSASSKIRGAVPTEISDVTYNVLSAPPDKENIRKGLLNVVREKLLNDIAAVNAVLKKANLEGITSEEPNVTLEEVETFLVEART
jgi:hypothetical protein